MLGDNDMPGVPGQALNKDILDHLHTQRHLINIVEKTRDERNQKKANKKRLEAWRMRGVCWVTRDTTPPLVLQRYRRQPISLDVWAVGTTVIVMLCMAAYNLFN